MQFSCLLLPLSFGPRGGERTKIVLGVRGLVGRLTATRGRMTATRRLANRARKRWGKGDDLREDQYGQNPHHPRRQPAVSHARPRRRRRRRSHLADDVEAIVDRRARDRPSTSSTRANTPKAATGCANADTASAASRDGRDRRKAADRARQGPRGIRRLLPLRPERGTLFYGPARKSAKKCPVQVCTGPVAYRGGRRCSGRSTSPSRSAGTEDVLTSTAPASLEVYRHNKFYKTRRGIRVRAVRSDARSSMRRSSPRASSCRSTMPGCRRCGTASASAWAAGVSAPAARCGSRRSITHCATSRKTACAIICVGAVGTARSLDLELDHIVDLMLKVKAQAYLIEGANARHEHEVAVWEK